MSSIKTTELQGDVSVGRNVDIGGNVNVQGNTLIKKNLKVDGWLDAKNIKGANKGVFTTIESLREAYPDGTLPEGSWAIVGGTLPGELWYVNGGVWVDSGKTAGNVTADVEQYQNDMEKLQGDVATINETVSQIENKDKAQDTSISALETATSNNATAINNLQDADKALQALLDQTHKMVGIEELDTLTDLTVATTGTPLLYTVKTTALSREVKVGLLIVFSDNLIHTITQTLFTHYLLTEAGGIDTGAHDHKLHIYNRYYRLQKENGEVGTWTTWNSVGGADVVDRIDDIITVVTQEIKDRQTADTHLQENVDAISKLGYRFIGVAKPDTDPGVPTQNVYYLAATAGSYSHFPTGMMEDNQEVVVSVAAGEIAVLSYNVNRNSETTVTTSGWSKQLLPVTFKTDIDLLQTKLDEETEARTQADSKLTEQTEELKNTSNARDTAGFSGIIDDSINLEQVGITLKEDTVYTVHYSTKEKCFVAKIGGKYYNYWTGSEKYMDGTIPYVNKIYIDESENIPYRWDGTDLVAIAAKANAASIYNPTVETGSYYVLCDTDDPSHSAVHVAKANRKTSLGLMITFALKKGTWKTYQYIGASTEDNAWYDTDNWKDFGSMVQGSEAMIDIDRLVPLQTGYYTLGTALSALKTYQESTAVNYQKRGLVISYATEANKVETKQYQGDSALTADFWEAGLWQDFGGGSKLTAKDAMESGGTDAWSTGGAYKTVPTEIAADDSGEGSVKLQLKNKAGDVLSETQFSVGTGTGGGGGTTVAINFEDDPFYVRAGGTAMLKAAIRSVTQLSDGSTQDNKITSVVFTNRTTKTVVASFRPNQASSSSLKAFNFEFDMTTIAADAGSVELQAIATDSTGHTATRNVELIAVDVTVESSQTLNYTKDTSLQVGGSKVSIPMFRFPHNASDKGIQTKIEIYKDSSWETLEIVLVKDTYTHNVTVDPTGLGHGAYPLRIQGTDVASGIIGNVLHTSVMVIEQRESVSDYNKPIVVARWYDDNEGKVKLFQTVTFDVACYQRDNANPTVEVSVTDVTKKSTESIASKTMNRSSYYTIEKRIVGYSDGDELSFDAAAMQQPTEQGGTATAVGLTEKPTFGIAGSLLSIAETEGAYYKISLAGRSNSDTDKSIKTTASDGSAVGITVHGSNYSTNGFVADNFGTEQTEGRMALRVAENVTAECTDKPFASNAIPTNGMALSLTFMVKNIAKRDAKIIRCMGGRLGFVLTGEKFIVSTNGEGADALKNVQSTAATSYLDGVVYRIDIVIEPQARAPYSGIMMCRVFQNGDESCCVPIDVSNGFPNFEDTIHFYGTDADLYLYELTRWNSYYDFIQAFNNYIVNLTDTSAMLTEYEQNRVMTDVTAEGTTKPRPDMQKLLDRGIMVCVMTRTKDSNLSKDGSAVTDSKIYYPDYVEPLKDKKTSVLMDWYLYFPDRPWANCKVEAVPVTNQGTSTLAYAIKNKKAKFKKAKKISLLYTREQISQMYGGDESILAKYDDVAALAKKKKIRIKEGSTPVNTITVKVDYSDSAGANNCALMELMNDTQIALGKDYMTPAQRYNTNKGESLHTSIDGVTCALFRTDYRIGQDKGSQAATLPENAYFHSKANFNVDKGNPHFFGFEDVEGYNLGCVNYGDFKEMVTPRGTAIDDYKSTVLSNPSSLIPGTLYMLSEFCGPETRFLENDGTGTMTEIDAVAVDEEHTLDKTLAEVKADDVSNYDWGEAYKTSDGKYVQYKGGKWKDTTGTMTFDNATKKWSIIGRVLNPVECYEYRQYQEFCWQQGVNSVDDMLKTLHTDDGDVAIWSTYYEMRYPDDDDLNALYAAGKKVPYQLYRELAFCQQCNQNLSEDATANAAKNSDGSEKIFNGAGASTTITLDGKTVAGTKANRLLKWQHEMHYYFSPESTNCYVVTSDYKATVDQRAKNMMAAVYLEADGRMRFYFNHWYDGDSCDEADNDCYLTIPWDMDGATSHLYQGWDGVMFQQSYALYAKGEGVWLDDKGSSTLTLHDTAAAMRGTKTSTGLDIFSADGCYRYWMTNRILKWPKVVSSFDGERKYIETATAADNHYPALHGLRLESLPAFQRKRFSFRDGYYQTGDLFKKFFQARMMGPITVKITAAQDGYFGMGVDSTSSAKYATYLKAGESHTFSDDAAGEGGKLIYIFGADKIGVLDLSGCTPKNSNWMIADCTILRKLVIGSESYNPTYTNDILSALSLGQMPFLEEIDIRNTKILTLNASGCPRLKSVLAEGSLLQNLSLAESSPVSTLHLPGTMSDIRLVNLARLSYGTGSGLTFEVLGNLKTLTVESCARIDGATLLGDAVTAGAKLTAVRVTGIHYTGGTTTLEALKKAGTIGLDSDNKKVCDGLVGVWRMSNYTDDDLLKELQEYFTSLEIIQQLYTDYKEFDDTKDTANVTNMDNNTGYASGTKYVASGHVLNIYRRSVPVKGKFDKSTEKMHLMKMSETNYAQLADGSDFDNKDTQGEGYDCFMYIPHFWYKGINDYKTQEKHTLLSGNRKMPEATYTRINRPKLSESLYAEGKGIPSSVTVGSTFADELLQDISSCSTYRLDVGGMKQARYIGLNNASYASVFTDSAGKILEVDKLNITRSSDSPLDFKNEDGYYIFRNVPDGAKWLYFTCIKGLTDRGHEILSVDSADIEAIEPGWVEHQADLIGIYIGAIDDSVRMRSISGMNSLIGTYPHKDAAWEYDAEGNPTKLSNDTLYYTCQDLLNLCRLRGKGYHSISYEQSKIIAILSRCMKGDRDDQRIYGFGSPQNYKTGRQDSIGKADTVYVKNSSVPNKIWGLEGFVGSNWEVMDYIGVNINTFKAWKAAHRPSTNDLPKDGKAHIYDPWTDTERIVPCIESKNLNISRLYHGRYCDTIPSSVSSDNSSYSTFFAANYNFNNVYTGFCVGRSYGDSNSQGGLFFMDIVFKSNDSRVFTFAWINSSARLAYDGAIDNESEIDAEA